jgi:hypothetical protein
MRLAREILFKYILEKWKYYLNEGTKETFSKTMSKLKFPFREIICM